MKKKLNNTVDSLNDDWIDEDEAPEFSDAELEVMNVKFSRNGKVICEAKGLSALHEKLKEIKPTKLKTPLRIYNPKSNVVVAHA
jgi:hypothetical protein